MAGINITRRKRYYIIIINEITFGFVNYLNDLPDLLRKYLPGLDAEIIACPKRPLSGSKSFVICVYANFVKQIGL